MQFGIWNHDESQNIYQALNAQNTPYFTLAW